MYHKSATNAGMSGKIWKINGEGGIWTHGTRKGYPGFRDQHHQLYRYSL